MEKFDAANVPLKDQEAIQDTVSALEKLSLLDETNDSPIGAMDSTSMFGSETTEGTESVESVDYNEEIEKKKEQQRIIDEHNKRIRETPEFKAQIVYNQYLQSNPYLTGQQKRRLMRDCLKNAKKGRYDYMFDEEKIRKREERNKAKEQERFDKLNKPKVHTVDDLSEETKTTLEAMADSSTVPPFNKETGKFEPVL